MNNLTLRDIWPASQLNFYFDEPPSLKQQETLKDVLSSIPFSGFLRVEVFSKRIIFSTTISDETSLERLISVIQEKVNQVVNNTSPLKRK